MCSTFKWLLAAQVLAGADDGRESLDEAVPIKADAIEFHSPVTEPRVGGTLTVAELCEAAVTQSDNAAANLLLARHGGPEGFTAFVRSIGDEWTRLDRMETELNSAIPGDPRDTTTINRGDLSIEPEERWENAYNVKADWEKKFLTDRFAGAFKFGAPPHGGSAPGIDRIVMLIADEPNIREVIVFPMNQKAEDLMMNAPAVVDPKQLKELNIKVTGEGAELYS